MEFLFVFLNYFFILTVFLFFQTLFNRFRITVAVGMLTFTFYGLLYGFVKEFRGNGLRAADIYAAETAMNVSHGYTLKFTEDRIKVIVYAFTFFLICCHVNYKSKKKDRILAGTSCLCFMIVISGMFSNQEFLEEYSVKPYLWELEASEMDHGAFLDFVAGLPYLRVSMPSDYSKEMADIYQQERADRGSNGLQVGKQGLNENPHIIVIMNESFADFRKIGNIETDQGFLDYWDILGENVIKGFVSVPVFGGWTANSEFEFLTGYSNAFFPSGVIPFQNYVKKDTISINSILKEQGYTSVFMHPMDSTGWNRKAVYQNLGFDYMYYLDDMKDAGMLRNAISDQGDYEYLIERFEEQKEDGPVFIFNVTMQNHGGYSIGGLENPIHILNPVGEYSQAEEYLTLIRESDRALNNLLGYFSQEEEPVLICMFGDHYPKVEEELYSVMLESSEGNEVQKTALKYQVPFMLYANYDIEEQEYDNISLNYLSTLLCEAADIPLSGYQQYLESLYEEFPVVNVYGVKDKSGDWYSWDEAIEFSEIQEYEMVQYRNLFDNRK